MRLDDLKSVYYNTWLNLRIGDRYRWLQSDISNDCDFRECILVKIEDSVTWKDSSCDTPIGIIESLCENVDRIKYIESMLNIVSKGEAKILLLEPMNEY